PATRRGKAYAYSRPHDLQISFAMDGETIYFAVDAKPKRSRDLKRLRNIAANPAVSVLVDHYEDDWTRRWWVRADGTARVVEDHAEADRATDALAGRYPQYRRARPAGPGVAIWNSRLSGWSASLAGPTLPVDSS